MTKILIVDDDRNILITLKAFLESSIYNVDTAETAADALTMLGKQTYDIIVSDIILPEMNGIELLRKIRQVSDDVQVIMMTGEPTIETATDALREGAMDYIQKPVYKTDIERVIGNAVKVKKLIDEKRQLETENRRYQEHLEELVIERTSELHKSYLQMQKEIDIKEQTMAEKNLLSTALEFAANAVVITDYEGTIVYVNPAFTKLTGYSAKEAAGQNPSILKSGKHSKDFYRDMLDTICSGRVWSNDIINKRKDGTLYTEKMTITPVETEEDEITHFIAIKQKKAE